MKHISPRLKNEISQLLAGIIAGLGILGIALLAWLLASDLIHWTWAVVWGMLAVAVLLWDVGWIDKHFVDGEWV